MLSGLDLGKKREEKEDNFDIDDTRGSGFWRNPIGLNVENSVSAGMKEEVQMWGKLNIAWNIFWLILMGSVS